MAIESTFVQLMPNANFLKHFMILTFPLIIHCHAQDVIGNLFNMCSVDYLVPGGTEPLPQQMLSIPS